MKAANAHGFESVGFFREMTVELPHPIFHNVVMRGWNGWYHCMCNTYGTWLRGDPRGWRTRHHREHVEGDYKHPPAPGTWERTYERSLRLMDRAAVHLTRQQRRIAVDTLIATLIFHGIETIAVSLDDHHLHLLARFRDHKPRAWLGIAKKNASRELSDRNLLPEGGIWGKRSKCEPVKDRQHQLAIFRYVLNHARQGAATWNFRQPAPVVPVRANASNAHSRDPQTPANSDQTPTDPNPWVQTAPCAATSRGKMPRQQRNG
jgi:hypothetical protein